MYYNIKTEENQNNIEDFKDLMKKNYYFTIKVNNNDYSKFVEEDLPIPNLIRYYDSHYIVLYIVDGYFGTKDGKSYLLDTIDKVSYTLGGEVIQFYLHNFLKYDKVSYDLTYLKYFDNLENSNQKKLKKRLHEVNQTRDKIFLLLGEDNLFESVRWEIYQTKIDNTLSYDKSYQIIEDKVSLLGLNKSISDIKAKAKNITQWTEDNYIVGQHNEDYHKDYYNNVRRIKEDRMSQSKHLKLVSEMKKNKTRSKILSSINELLKSDMKFNKTNLSKISKISRPTLDKNIDLFLKYL